MTPKPFDLEPTSSNADVHVKSYHVILILVAY